MKAVLRIALFAFVIAGLVGAGYFWAVPVEVAQGWALQNAPSDPLAQFEAAGRREAVWWLGRVACPLLALAAVWALGRADRIARLSRSVARGLWNATAVADSPLSSIVLRAVVGCWIILAGAHCVHGVRQRIADWPVYRLRSGPEVLPNISQSNRDVIRYLEAMTPPEAKILVLSDQKLFFLSYYLRPRQLFHPMHPKSEFVIPLAHGERPLAAYRLDELSSEYVGQLDPDYVLEYFEHPSHFDPQRLASDESWVRFYRARYGPESRPEFLVVLRPAGESAP
jgi:hypothetical protein